MEFNLKEEKILEHKLGPQECDLSADLDEMLSESLELRLQRDLEIPYFLSGGIDSNLLVSISKRKLGYEPTTLSATFKNTNYDESEFILNTINKLGLKNSQIINITPNEYIYDIINNIHLLTDQPFSDSSFVVTKYLCNVAKKLNFKGYIGADGADECFWGYLKYRNLSKYLKLRGIFHNPIIRNFNKKINYSAAHPIDEIDVILSSKEHPYNSKSIKKKFIRI